MIDLDPTLTVALLDIAIGQAIPQIPPDGEDDDLGGSRNPTIAELWIAGTGRERRDLIAPPLPPGATLCQCNSALP